MTRQEHSCNEAEDQHHPNRAMLGVELKWAPGPLLGVCVEASDEALWGH